jgi:hypothetical protein
MRTGTPGGSHRPFQSSLIYHLSPFLILNRIRDSTIRMLKSSTINTTHHLLTRLEPTTAHDIVVPRCKSGNLLHKHCAAVVKPTWTTDGEILTGEATAIGWSLGDGLYMGGSSKSITLDMKGLSQMRLSEGAWCWVMSIASNSAVYASNLLVNESSFD